MVICENPESVREFSVEFWSRSLKGNRGATRLTSAGQRSFFFAGSLSLTLALMASAQYPSPMLRHPSSSSSLITSRIVCRSCDESVDRMQLVAELLLLRSGAKPISLYPVARSGESYSKSRDVIVANTKGLAVCIKELTKNLKDSRLSLVEATIEQIADKVTLLTEAAAHAAYLSAMVDPESAPATPGVVDQYAFSKANQLVSISCKKLELDRGLISKEQILALSQVIATNMAVVRQGCLLASENGEVEEEDQLQFESCVNCLDGALSCFITSLKRYTTTLTTENRQLAATFSVPLVSGLRCIVEYANRQQFSGLPASLTLRGEHSQTEILAAAMAIVSASTQLLHTASGLLKLQHGGVSGEGEKQWHRLVSCARAVADACKLLASSIREHTPASSPQLPRASPSQPFP